MADANDLRALVCDNGSGTMKVGFAGDPHATAVFPSLVARPNEPNILPAPRVLVGNEARIIRPPATRNFPIKKGIVSDWHDMKELWKEFYNRLLVSSSERPVLLTEVSFNPKTNREKMAEVMFETFHVPAMYVANQAVLPLYARNILTGRVLYSGHGVTEAVPVSEGYRLPHAIGRLDELAGEQITRNLHQKLAENRFPIGTLADEELVSRIKEEWGYISLNYEQERQAPVRRTYRLPDGSQTFTIEEELFTCPEALFTPRLSGARQDGIHELTYNSIMRCDADLRDFLFRNICLSGGSTRFPGLRERMIREITALAPGGTEIPVESAEDDRVQSVWVGGSILASLNTFPQMCISRSEYDESGSVIVGRKCH